MSDNDGNNLREKDRANLLNGTLSYDQIRDKVTDNVDVNCNGNRDVMDEVMKNLNNNKTTETDMMFEYFANPEKMVPNENIKVFEKSKQCSENYNNDTAELKMKQNTESLNDYMVGSQQNNQSNIKQPDLNQNSAPRQNTAPEIKGGTNGPSFGDGVPSIGTADDKLYGFASQEELNLAKLEMLRKLGELTHIGVRLSQNYNMKSDYKAMKYEFDLHRSIKDKRNGVKWMSNMMLNICWGIELGNDAFNPFEFKLKGWTEQLNEEVDEYYDVLGELYEKWFKTGTSIPPEIKFMFLLGGSAFKFHMENASVSQIPDINKALSNNPELAKKLNRQVAASKAKEQYKKQKEILDKETVKNHDTARKKAEDLQELEIKHDEYNKMQENKHIQQQYMRQQILQQQMMQRQMMQQQTLQQELLNKHKQLEDLQKQLNQQRSDSRSNYTNGSNIGEQKTMSKPSIPASVKNKFSVISKKQSQSKTVDTISNKPHDLSSIDPDIDKIIGDAFNDNQSQISVQSKKSQRNKSNTNKIVINPDA